LFYPNLSTPANRRLQLVVSDGQNFAQRLSDVPTRTEPVDAKTPSYRQISTGDGWEATTTYVADPARASVVVDVALTSQSGKPLQAYAIHEPTLSKDGSDDRGRSDGATLVASDRSSASALRAAPGFTATSSRVTSAPATAGTDLSKNKKLTSQYPEAGPGHTGQVGQLPIDGIQASHAVLTLGFGGDEREALSAAQDTESAGFDATSRAMTPGGSRTTVH
jgi:glucoamylase